MDGERRAWGIAANQVGLVSRRQALSAGMTRWQVAYRARERIWERVAPQVFRLPGAPLTWEQRLKALALWAGNGSLFSHSTAATLWGLSRFPPQDVLHLTLRGAARQPHSEVVLHRAGRLEARDVGSTRGFRVTSVTRTLLDVAASATAFDLRAATEDALRRKLTSAERIAAFVERHPHHRGVRPLRTLVERLLGEALTESELECRVLDFLEVHGFPAPVRQRAIVLSGRCRRIDFVYPDGRIVIEADGYAWHCSPIAFEKDRARVSQLTARGYRVLQWTWAALEQRPAQLIQELRQLWLR